MHVAGNARVHSALLGCAKIEEEVEKIPMDFASYGNNNVVVMMRRRITSEKPDVKNLKSVWLMPLG